MDQPTPASSWYRAMFSGWYCKLSETYRVFLSARRKNRQGVYVPLCTER